jgi:hypothetical protein
MINLPLYKQGIKSNYKICLIFLTILTMYITIIVSMYDPQNAGLMAEFADTMPEMMAMVGMSGVPTNLTTFLVTYLYGFLFLVIPLVSIIIFSNKLVASHTDKGSISYLLASPNKRKKIVLTQISVLLTFVFTIIIYSTFLSILTSSLIFPGDLLIPEFLFLNLGLLILHITVSGICFIGSCIANESKTSLMIGAGIPLISFLIQMLANMGGKLDSLKYLSFFTLFDTTGLLKFETNSIIMIIILLIIGITLYSAAYKIFIKKDFSV